MITRLTVFAMVTLGLTGCEALKAIQKLGDTSFQ